MIISSIKNNKHYKDLVSYGSYNSYDNLAKGYMGQKLYTDEIIGLILICLAIDNEFTLISSISKEDFRLRGHISSSTYTTHTTYSILQFILKYSKRYISISDDLKDKTIISITNGIFNYASCSHDTLDLVDFIKEIISNYKNRVYLIKYVLNNHTAILNSKELESIIIELFKMDNVKYLYLYTKIIFKNINNDIFIVKLMNYIMKHILILNKITKEKLLIFKLFGVNKFDEELYEEFYRMKFVDREMLSMSYNIINYRNFRYINTILLV